MSKWLEQAKRLLKSVGPGLVAGASDNDPTTVATLSVVGATTGFALSWLIICILPMLAVVQVIASQVGLVTKGGLQGLARQAFGRRWAVLLLVSVLAVNLITLGADLEAGAAAVGLLVPVPARWTAVPFALVLLGLLAAGSYDEVQRVLKYVLIIFVGYVAAAILAHPKWSAVAQATVPHLSLNRTTAAAVLAIMGTTLTSYAYVWEEEEESEDERRPDALRLVWLDAVVGIVVAVAVFWFIVIATGATLGLRHEPVQTAQQAATALRPLAGPLAGYLFGAGLFASAVIAVPVLALVSARFVCEQMGWRAGLSYRPEQAKPFYVVVAAALGLGALVAVAGIPTITLLFYASIAGGLGTPVSLAFLLLVSRHRGIMGNHPVQPALAALGWLTALVVTIGGLAFLATQL